MRKAAPIFLAALTAPAVFAGEVQVRASGSLVDVVATAAPLQEVLARLAQQTGMKVVYDGTPPRTVVTVSLPQRTPVEAVLALFEGLGLNYALSTDRSGTKVDTLILSAAVPVGGVSARPGAVPPPPTPAIPDPRRLPPRPQPTPDEDEQTDEEDPRPQPAPTPPGPVIFQGPIPGPGRPGSPFGGQIGPLMPLTPVPAAPGTPSPVPSPTPSPSS